MNVYSHFEDDNVGYIGENSSIEYSVSLDSNPITGRVTYSDHIDNEISNSFVMNNLDFGEFMDSTADIHPNKMKHAICGTLSIRFL